jgi:hypothetical protein
MGASGTAHESIEARHRLRRIQQGNRGSVPPGMGFFVFPRCHLRRKKDRCVHTRVLTCAYMYVKPEMDQGGGVVIIFEILVGWGVEWAGGGGAATSAV